MVATMLSRSNMFGYTRDQNKLPADFGALTPICLTALVGQPRQTLLEVRHTLGGRVTRTGFDDADRMEFYDRVSALTLDARQLTECVLGQSISDIHS